jgi:23S rRNA pseudouridine1911/1915/1917 synthase
MHELLAVATDAGTRLDRFLAAHCPELSRVQELIEAGMVLVNGKPPKSSQKLRGGKLITVASSERD